MTNRIPPDPDVPEFLAGGPRVRARLVLTRSFAARDGDDADGADPNGTYPVTAAAISQAVINDARNYNLAAPKCLDEDEVRRHVTDALALLADAELIEPDGGGGWQITARGVEVRDASAPAAELDAALSGTL